MVTVALAILLFSFSGFSQQDQNKSTQRDAQKKRKSASLGATTGLFKTWDAETLRQGEANFNVGFDHYNCDPGQQMTDVWVGRCRRSFMWIFRARECRPPKERLEECSFLRTADRPGARSSPAVMIPRCDPCCRTTSDRLSYTWGRSRMAFIGSASLKPDSSLALID